jgi:hypothetical protein
MPPPAHSHVHFRCIEAENDEIWKSGYDMITCFEVLEHVNDWKGIAKRMCGSSNRYILISSPSRWNGKVYPLESEVEGHVRSFKKNEIERFMNENGFRTVNVFYAGFPYNTLFASIMYGSRKFHTFYHGKKLNGAVNETNLIGTLLWVMLKYFSSRRNFGRQFVGLFERQINCPAARPWGITKVDSLLQ